MGALLVTVDGPNQRRQLSLPDDWPIRDLMPVLVDFVGEGTSEAGLWILHSGGRRLPEDQSLTACGVADGATLVLDRLPARIPLRPEDVVMRLDTSLWKPSTDPVPIPTRELHPPQPAPPAPTPAPPVHPARDRSSAPPARIPAASAPPARPKSASRVPSRAGPRTAEAPKKRSSPAAATATEVASPAKLPQGKGGPAAPPAPPRQSQPSTGRGRRRAGVVGVLAVLVLAGGGAWWAFARPRPQPPAPPRALTPTVPPTRGLPPIAHLSAVVHGTIVGTDSIQVGYFARTPEGATEAGHNYLWALAGTGDASTLLKGIAAPGQARTIAVVAQENKDLLLEQFYLGFRNAQPQLPRYTLDEATITVPVAGQTFLVYLRWVPDPTGGDWKLTAVQRLDPGAPPPHPAPS